jgi:hypothetical protein
VGEADDEGTLPPNVRKSSTRADHLQLPVIISNLQAQPFHIFEPFARTACEITVDDLEELGQRYFVSHLRRCSECDALSFRFLQHHISVVETEDTAPIVNEHVEVLQKIGAQISALL